jgi:hypothetical protein
MVEEAQPWPLDSQGTAVGDGRPQRGKSVECGAERGGLAGAPGVVVSVGQRLRFGEAGTVGSDERSSGPRGSTVDAVSEGGALGEQAPEAEGQAELGLGGEVDQVVGDDPPAYRHVAASETPAGGSASLPPAVRRRVR